VTDKELDKNAARRLAIIRKLLRLLRGDAKTISLRLRDAIGQHAAWRPHSL